MENKLTKILLSLIILSVSLLAEVTHKYPTLENLNAGMPIVDIRTPPEWKETGIVKDSITIMFFNEQGGYDVNAFLKELNRKVNTKKPFALICRTGSRTQIVSDFLSKQLKYNVTNFKGGIYYMKKNNIPTVTYKK